MTESEQGAILMREAIARLVDDLVERHKGDVYESLLRGLARDIRVLPPPVNNPKK